MLKKKINGETIIQKTAEGVRNPNVKLLCAKIVRKSNPKAIQEIANSDASNAGADW